LLRRLQEECHQEVFARVSTILVEKPLLKGNMVALDAITMEANAAMRSIVRRDTNIPYPERHRAHQDHWKAPNASLVGPNSFPLSRSSLLAVLGLPFRTGAEHESKQAFNRG